ncbi:hypothetical protein [Paraburkholderia sp. DHOC27]|uniref:hypothetical protein n=1 Tax=Paraburkholderia sp. DHOC27 TaxID=2303330 RepID=UPI000E3CE973|nr:hypothetical protein [Paraburkholderia sp. DHOC27]RFU48934.1 hypothetical protein D0B32_03630 [Paraburkholderia sp. DHOC27]
MNHTSPHEIAEAAILARMSASRIALLDANRLPVVTPGSKGQARPAATVLAALRDAPRVTLLVALGVSAIVLGPRKAVSIAGRAGAAAWLGSSARKLVQAVSVQQG